MKTLIQIILMSTLLNAGIATAMDRFIPYTPLDASGKAVLKEKLSRSRPVPDEEIERMAKDVERWHTYRDADIFAVFPQLRGHRKLSECSNSIMGGAAELVFLANKGQNTATLEKSRCGNVSGGLMCSPVTTGTYYFLDGTERYFTLDGLTFDTARDLLEAYRDKRVTGLPDYIRPGRMNISTITKLPNQHYQMIFGEPLCEGCFSKMEVERDTQDGETHLTIIGQADTICF